MVFANLYFAAVSAFDGSAATVPVAWRPLFAARSTTGIAGVQFALAGMNTHINHDLPLAVVRTCGSLGTAPDSGSHHADYQKVDALLDAAEQSVRQSFETGDARRADHDVQGVLDLVCNWSMMASRCLLVAARSYRVGLARLRLRMAPQRWLGGVGMAGEVAWLAAAVNEERRQILAATARRTTATDPSRHSGSRVCSRRAP